MNDYDEDFAAPDSPTLVEMWKHQVVLMTNEAEYLNTELLKARQNIAKLVAINAELADQLRGVRSADILTPPNLWESALPAIERAALANPGAAAHFTAPPRP
ncbi:MULTISPECIES: hypothetical protein [Pseudomonas]|uniref:Uncharacterized protein n=2 Tax=Pseudomonas donghuensis TaxID=1163398 RepID=A0AAP0SEG6_9PSED|nr:MULTISPECIES: hypothetical protein [Pseudomonas]MDF9893693.1 hypothetical protein [Pseudomonas vranovensis]KDN96959.2 hypothetical protein BV82_5168 [Pseudomonas donghuensis]MBS7601258.1 hypothetical protein [Pseudomonas sp. RC2C2]MCP6692445.1 hypothetical protein [Pseudomonas donghuensis]MCP6697885.1 hypothetical protein [Pseudomonas donghuensis]